jgi:hypothetical protein
MLFVIPRKNNGDKKQSELLLVQSIEVQTERYQKSRVEEIHGCSKGVRSGFGLAVAREKSDVKGASAMRCQFILLSPCYYR